MVLPPPEVTIAGIDLSLVLLGTYRNTSKSGHEEEVIFEVDGTLIDDKTRRREVVVSGMAYYDWESLAGAETRLGATFAAVSQITLRVITFEAVYYFRCVFLGEVSFTA